MTALVSLPVIMKRRLSSGRSPRGRGNHCDGVAGKLNSASAFAIGELSLASTLIIDGLLDEALQAKLTQHGIETIRADAE